MLPRRAMRQSFDDTITTVGALSRREGSPGQDMRPIILRVGTHDAATRFEAFGVRDE
jgi:hypothetical protein